ncbi:MAG TPA: RNA polymerase factor sigma-54 [Candidatus Dormibacteraeota bacterium]|nr:RNA polymerase factor sigma-54 [Candidatus Dormibacteraeota bacterium]
MSMLQPKLHLKLAQKQILTPSLVQMVSVLALNRLELREMINQEIMANPVLEELGEEGLVAEKYTDQEFAKKETEKVPETEAPNPFDEFDISAFHQYLNSAGDNNFREREQIEKPSFEQFISSPQKLADYLTWQLGASPIDERTAEIAREIIGNLNENGYLTATVEEIAAAGPYSAEEVKKAIEQVQQFDPPGVAARDLSECLLLQLRLLNSDNSLAEQIVTDHLKQLQTNQLREIARALNRPVDVVKRAVETIRKLDPRPGLRYNVTAPALVEPDVYFRKVSGEWQAFLNDDEVPQLRISPTYSRMLARGAADRDVRNYVRERLAAAMQLMKNIEQRKHTILRVCDAIIRRQGECLEYGMDHLKPMMIKEVAEDVGVHPSTVSRAVSSKYAHTPHGVLELRTFFSEAVNGPQGYHVSLVTLKRRVRKMIEEENSAKPFTDDQIAKQLDAEGIHVTRRTVAKYREDMRIPSTHQRRVKP